MLNQRVLAGLLVATTVMTTMTATITVNASPSYACQPCRRAAQATGQAFRWVWINGKKVLRAVTSPRATGVASVGLSACAIHKGCSDAVNRKKRPQVQNRRRSMISPDSILSNTTVVIKKKDLELV
jgi:hypothetical protein